MPEAHMQLAFRLLWYGSDKDVNREVNNGRGPVDFKISFGSGDKCIIEFKWASNTKLKENLQFQPEIYAKANGTKNKLCVVLYTSKHELARVEKVLMEIGKTGDKNIILIDASKKKSASNVTYNESDFNDSLSDTINMMNNEFETAIGKIDLDLPPID